MTPNLSTLAVWLLAAIRPAAAPEHAGDQTALAREVRGKGWILFGARTPTGDWDLHVMRPDGSAPRNLTRTPTFNEGLPRVSPNGQRLLYRRIAKDVRFDANRHGIQGHLLIARVDGSQAEVFGAEGACPWATWAPDGNQILCLEPGGITFVDVSTKKAIKNKGIDRQGFFQQAAWSPDGKVMVGVSNALGSGWIVASMDLTSKAVVAIGKANSCTPDWFPDGRQVIYSQRPGAWTQLWRANADGSGRQLVYAEDGRHTYGGAASPDGHYVLFTGNKREDGDAGNAGAPMAIVRMSDSPMVGGSGGGADLLRRQHPGARSGPVLELPTGWEPVWIAGPVGTDP